MLTRHRRLHFANDHDDVTVTRSNLNGRQSTYHTHELALLQTLVYFQFKFVAFHLRFYPSS